MASNPLPPIDFLRECVDYDPETGRFVWRERPLSHFREDHIGRTWNKRLAGLTAFTTVDRDGYLRGEVLQLDGPRWRVRAHRAAFLLMTGRTPDLVDHINGRPDDNRWANLREADSLGNARNRRSKKGLPKGVFAGYKGRFEARIGYQDRKIYLGIYDTPGEAHAAYCAFAQRHHGEFFNDGRGFDGAFA